MSTLTVRRCSGRVWGDFRYHACTAKGIVEREGEWWCKRHDPEAVRLRQEKRDAEYAAQRARQDAAWARSAADRKIVEVARKCYRQQASYDDLMTAVAEREGLEPPEAPSPPLRTT